MANGDFNYNLAYPLEDPLVIAISDYLNIKRDYVYVGAGSSQFIGAIVGLKCWDKIFLSNIEFALYKRTATIAEKKIKYIDGINTNEFITNLKKLKSKENDLLCISSPRWFSGELFSKKQIKEILNIFQGTIIIDEAYIQGKVMSGISAGGICWFSYGNSVIPTDEKRELIKLSCLGFKNMIFAPHCDEINGHFENVENLLLGENTVGVSLSNACALEIVDDKYKIITADTDRYKIHPFALKSFWYKGQYYVENVDIVDDFCEYEKLTTPIPTGKDAPEDVKKLLKRRNIYFK